MVASQFVFGLWWAKINLMSDLSVADLTIDELRWLIREAVAEAITELMADPDANLELRDEFVMELQSSIDQHRQGVEETRAIEDVARELGLEW